MKSNSNSGRRASCTLVYKVYPECYCLISNNHWLLLLLLLLLPLYNHILHCLLHQQEEIQEQQQCNLLANKNLLLHQTICQITMIHQHLLLNPLRHLNPLCQEEGQQQRLRHNRPIIHQVTIRMQLEDLEEGQQHHRLHSINQQLPIIICCHHDHYPLNYLHHDDQQQDNDPPTALQQYKNGKK